MIIFELACAAGHRFEGWFASSKAFALQQERALVACPECGSADVRRIPHAKIARGDAESPPRLPGGGGSGQHSPAARFEAAAAFVRHVLENTEDVGPAFAEEARRIHYQEVPQRDPWGGIRTGDPRFDRRGYRRPADTGSAGG